MRGLHFCLFTALGIETYYRETCIVDVTGEDRWREVSEKTRINRKGKRRALCGNTCIYVVKDRRL
jgi:hypothetical protein